jgi:glycosyltransferase involved in cell wall biosynthesis
VLQIFKNCEAFAKIGVEVLLVHPGRRPTPELSQEDSFAFYQVDPCFAIREVRIPDLVALNLPDALDRVAFLVQGSLFGAAASRRYPAAEGSLLYTRDFAVATLLSAARRDFLFELHSLPTGGAARAWLRFVTRRALGTVVISRHLAEDCRGAGVAEESLFLAPDAVDRRLVDLRIDPADARRKLRLPLEGPIATYTGHLGRFYVWKGLGTILGCAERLPDVRFVIVGGSPGELQEVAASARDRRLSNVVLVGWVRPGEVADYLAASDVLLLPNSGKSALSARHTSPMKAFEYLAAGRPVVASDLPSLREIFASEVDALLVPPDDPDVFARAIRRLLDDRALSRRLSAAAREKAGRCSWEARARAVVEFARRRGARLSSASVATATASP